MIVFVTSANNLQAARASDALIFNLSTRADGVINFIYIEQRLKKLLLRLKYHAMQCNCYRSDDGVYMMVMIMIMMIIICL